MFPKLTKTNFVGILYDLVYVLDFLGGTWKDGVAMYMRRELKGSGLT